MLLAPGLSASTTAHDRYRALLGSTAILIAAERHRCATGQWPAAIAEIESQFLPSVPVDPYTGEPFRLLHRDGQLIIHSVGANLRDEQGSYNVRKSATDVLDDVGAVAWDPSLRGQPAPPESETDPASPAR